jgi:hypothetical protein
MMLAGKAIRSRPRRESVELRLLAFDEVLLLLDAFDEHRDVVGDRAPALAAVRLVRDGEIDEFRQDGFDLVSEHTDITLTGTADEGSDVIPRESNTVELAKDFQRIVDALDFLFQARASGRS